MPPLRSARYARAIVAVLIVSAFALGSASGANAAPVACGDTLASPGVYTLTANLNCSAMPPSTSALLSGGDVTINLNGYSIIGPGGTVPTFATIPTIGIETGGDTTIKNGIIRGFDIGIYRGPDVYGQVTNMRLTKNGIGLWAQIGGGTTLSSSFINESLSDGVYVNPNSGGAFISDTQISRNGGNGITDFEAPLFAFRNVITGNHGYGIWNFDWGADIENNQVNNNGADGIYIGPDHDSPDTWTLLNNTANQNGGHGINFQGHFGNPPWIWPPVTFEGNRASGNQTPPQCVNIFCRTS